MIRGEATVPPEPGPPAEETASETIQDEENSLTVAEQLLKDFERANDSKASRFDKAMVEQ